MTLCLYGDTIKVRRSVAFLLLELPDDAPGNDRRAERRLRTLRRLQAHLRNRYNIPDGFYATLGTCGSSERPSLEQLEQFSDDDLDD